MKEKKCRKCKETLDLLEFPKMNLGKYGVGSTCVKCICENHGNYTIKRSPIKRSQKAINPISKTNKNVPAKFDTKTKEEILKRDKVCIMCDISFQSKIWNQKLCGKECARLYNNKKKVEWNKTPEGKTKKGLRAKNDYKKNKDKIIERVKNWRPYKHICRECGIEFNDGRKNSKFCNVKCMAKNSKITRLGEKNPAFRNGFYTKENKKKNITTDKERQFIKNYRELDEKMIKDRGYIYCEECDTSNTFRFEHHHIIYRSEKPKHEFLHDKRNIITLCMKCHNKYHKHKSHRNDLVEQRKLNELFGSDILNK